MILSRTISFFSKRKQIDANPPKPKPLPAPRIHRDYHTEYWMADPKVMDWQRREADQGSCAPSQTRMLTDDVGQIFDDVLDEAQEILQGAQQRIKYVKDKEDYWPTSYEVVMSLADDCDGFAIYVWSMLRTSGFPPDSIGMVYVPGDPGHMCACIHETENDFWILDNGYLTKEIKKAREVFPVKRNGVILNPRFGFNLEKSWRYRGR